MSRKVILLGIDGATPSLLLSWVAQGKLPNLARVLREGAYGPLQSTIPPYTAEAWVSMMTGRHPSKHGVLDFFERDADHPCHVFIGSAEIDGEAIWDILGRHGKQVGVVNVPLTYPPRPVHGYMVSGFMTPHGRDDYTYPAGLLAEILSVTRQYDPDPWDLADPERDVASFRRWMEVREQAARYLHDNHPVDFYVNVIQALDQLQHSFWDLLTQEEKRQAPAASKLWPVIEDCYLKMDEVIGQRLAWLDGETTLFLASDHGFQAANTWFYVNRWLAERGFLQRATKGQSRLARTGLDREKVKMWVRRLDPLGLRRQLGRFTRASIADKLDDALASPIDWSRTAAYSGSRTSEGIYINVRGREKEGIIAPGAEYEEVRSRIMGELAALVDPATGQPVVSAVYRREDLYSGKHLARLPDILFAFDDKPYLVSESTARGPVFAPIGSQDVSGRHHSQGFFAAVGPGIVPGRQLTANIVDVAPTILHALGLPIPEDMDGHVVEQIFTAEHLQAHLPRRERAAEGIPEAGLGRQDEWAERQSPGEPLGTGDSEPAPEYTAEEEAAMERRLRGLGYID